MLDGVPTDTPAVRGEKQWEGYSGKPSGRDTKWENNSEGTRTPYIHSAVQLSEEDDDDLEMDDQEDSTAVHMESSKGIPLNFDFVHLSFEDGELVKMEESEKVPLNFRF
jgi:hypothetical protein